LGKPKTLQVEEDKELTEDIVYAMNQTMSLNGEDIGWWIGYPMGLSQSIVISSKPIGRGLG
jgi:hypothetical protein